MKLDAELLEKARQIRLLIFGSVWYRFALALMGFGVLLLGGSEYVEDLITYTLNQFETYRDFKPGTRGIDVFSQVVGAGMIVFSVLLFIYFIITILKGRAILLNWKLLEHSKREKVSLKCNRSGLIKTLRKVMKCTPC